MISFVQFFVTAAILLCLQVSIATSAVAADRTESDDYLDCLLDKLPGTDSDRAAELIKAACRERFSRPVLPKAEQPRKRQRGQKSLSNIFGLGLDRLKIVGRQRLSRDSKGWIADIVLRNRDKLWLVREIGFELDQPNQNPEAITVPIKLRPGQTMQLRIRLFAATSKRARLRIKSARGERQ